MLVLTSWRFEGHPHTSAVAVASSSLNALQATETNLTDINDDSY